MGNSYSQPNFQENTQVNLPPFLRNLPTQFSAQSLASSQQLHQPFINQSFEGMQDYRPNLYHGPQLPGPLRCSSPLPEGNLVDSSPTCIMKSGRTIALGQRSHQPHQAPGLPENTTAILLFPCHGIAQGIDDPRPGIEVVSAESNRYQNIASHRIFNSTVNSTTLAE